MAQLPCDWCNKMGHAWFQCPDPKRPIEWKPERLRSAAALKVVQSTNASDVLAGRSGTLADTILELREKIAKVGRPRIHPDRKAYKADMERKRRLKLKEGK